MAIQPVSFWARIDSNSANNPALNLTGDDALELTFLAETSTGGLGDLHLDQPSGGGVDPDTQVEIGGTSYEFVFEYSGTLPTQASDGAQQVPDQFEGSAVVVITVQDYPSSGETTRIAFMPQEAATETEMNDFGNGAIDIQNLDETPPATPICFVEGTLIATPDGPVPVERLRAGDQVVTMDDGVQPVRWIASTRFDWPDDTGDGKPILIRSGALGPGLPARDLCLSPQHRVLVAGSGLGESAGSEQAFVPAQALTALPGVRRMRGKRSTTYYHLLLDRHAVLGAEGMAAESFFPGPMALAALGPSDYRDLMRICPGLHQGGAAGYGPLARPALKHRIAREIVCRERVAGGEIQAVRISGPPDAADPKDLGLAA